MDENSDSVNASDLQTRIEDLESKNQELDTTLVNIRIDIENINMSIRELRTKLNIAIPVIEDMNKKIQELTTKVNSMILEADVPSAIPTQKQWMAMNKLLDIQAGNELGS